MQERSKRINVSPADACARPFSGPRVGLSAINGAGSTDPKASPRLALRISRRWAAIAPMLRVSLPDITTLETCRVEHSEWLTGLLRAGVDMRKIVRLKLDDVTLSRSNRETLLVAIVEENKNDESKQQRRR